MTQLSQSNTFSALAVKSKAFLLLFMFVCVCSSMLKEPISESLQCLCSLGLVHGDVTLASATLTELLKLGERVGGAVEEHCLLTCTLLALQGNYSGVHREAARAIHRYFIIFRDSVS